MGFASPLDEQQVDRMTLDEWLITDTNATYIVRMEGDAMQDAHILDGDYLLVLRTDKVFPGDMVLALQEDEVFVRYLQKNPEGTLYLATPNQKETPVTTPAFTIQGKITAVIHQIESPLSE